MSAAWRMVSQSDLLPMITATSGLTSMACSLLPLRQRESRLPVERLQPYSLHDFETRADDALQYPEHLRLSHHPSAHRSEPAAKAIRAERFRHAVRPDLNAAIVDHGQRHAVSTAALGPFAELFGRAAGPVNLHIHAHQFPLRIRLDTFHVRARPVAGGPAVAHRFQRLRLLPHPLHHG